MPGALPMTPDCTSLAMSAGSSRSGSSVVMMKKSERSAAALPIPGRSWSERAVEPKTAISRPRVKGRSSANALASAPAECEVDENAEVLAEVDALQPSAHSIEAGQSRTDLLDGHAHREADTRCAERVVNVEARRDGKRHLGLAEWRLEPEARARRRHREVEWVQVGGGGHAVGPASRDRAAR